MKHQDLSGRTIWVRTYTGKKINLLDLKPEDISPKDIAHHLSLQNRFIGATPHGYSTAQHSIHVMQLADRMAPAPVTTMQRLQALLHDGEEAYLGDIITPVKKDQVGALLREFGNHLRGDILEILGVDRIIPPYIKAADSLICAQEVRDLIGDDPEEWDLPTPWVQSKIHPWPAYLAEQRFLAEFNRLMNVLEQERRLSAISVYAAAAMRATHG